MKQTAVIGVVADVMVDDQAVRAFLLAPGTRVGWDIVLGITMAFTLVIMI